MLEELSISGLGVIDAASAQFSPGFTALTGETGAGKTMIVTSLRLLAGGRADAGRVRQGSAKATVEGRLRIAETADGLPDEIAELVESSGAELDDDGTVIAVRSVGADGRSRAHLGGRSVPVGVLGRLVSSVLTVHGQNDQLRLLRPDRQRAALDSFAGTKAHKAVAAYQRARAEWLALLDELDDIRANSRDLAQDADRLRAGITEIDAAGVHAGEDDELADTIRRLSDLESIRSAASKSHEIVAGDSESVVESLGQVRSLLGDAADAELNRLSGRVSDVLTVVTDIGDELTTFLSALPSDAQSLDSLLTRQSELKSLTRKYAPDITGVITWRDTAQARLAQITDPHATIADLEKRADTARAAVEAAATTLHAVRVKAATSLSSKVSRELSGLAMGDASLRVAVVLDDAEEGGRLSIDVDGQRTHAGSEGADRIEFALVPHSRARPLPIATSASGGELSRVMLALEVVLAEPTSGSVMVFDEVDAGVGGRAAVEIGRRLAKLARAHQVIVVTHLPQVAAFADNHLLIGKTASKGKVHTSTVRALDRGERVGELARMLAGLGESDTGKAHAEELLATAEAERDS